MLRIRHPEGTVAGLLLFHLAIFLEPREKKSTKKAVNLIYAFERHMYLLEKGAICFQVFLPPKTPEEREYM